MDQWNAFHVLGLNAQEAAVRELRMVELASEEEGEQACSYPGIPALEHGRPSIEQVSDPLSTGVTLRRWKLPAVGSASLVDAHDPSWEIFRVGKRSDGCTSHDQSATALEQAKTSWKEQGLTWDAPVKRVELVPLLTKGFADYKGNCFAKKGCTLKRTAKLDEVTLELALTQRATSDCVTSSAEELEMGCQVKRTFSGTASLGSRTVPFVISVPESGDNSDFTLQTVQVYAQGTTVVAFALFSRVYLSAREKVPVLIRLR